MTEVIFYPVPYHDWLLVSKEGIFKSSVTGNILKGSITDYGYHVIRTRIDSERVRVLAHRAIALTFIPNPENKPCINHIDSNKLNNNIDNLEWVYVYENNIHRHINSKDSRSFSDLTKEDYDLAFLLRGEGYSYKDLNEYFNLNVVPSRWGSIFSGRRMSRVTGIIP